METRPMTPRSSISINPRRRLYKSAASATQATGTIRTDVAGRRFGNLTIEYRDTRRPRRLTCRCCCGRLVNVAIDDLVTGLVASCGCQPPTPAFHQQQAELRKEVTRMAMFQMAMPLVWRGK